METNSPPRSRFINPRLFLALALCVAALFPAARVSAQTASPSGWSNVPSPNRTSGGSNVLEGVTCVSASDCWAVGSYFSSSALQTLIQHWDGNAWSIVPSPNAVANGPNQHNRLNSVTCTSASDCWAVGTYRDNEIDRTLIVRWDGSAWSIVPSRNNGPRANVLSGVTCTSGSDCFAAGHYIYDTGDPVFKPTAAGTLIQRWDGSTWSIVPSPDQQVPGCFPFPSSSCTRLDNVLRDVTCTSASDCWAIGSAGISSLIERWDGRAWRIVDRPSNGESTFLLQSVTCTSAADCWAVGSYLEFGNDEEPKTLIHRWDGSAWTFVPSPNPGGSAALSDVACSSPSQCWAVGGYNGGNKTLALIQRWDGTSWTNVDSPDGPGENIDLLNSVTCTSDADCWAVGFSSAPGFPQTLIQRYTRASVAPAQLQNISTRLRVQTGDNVMIGGFIVTGTAPKKVVLRAIGPSLASSGSPVAGRLSDPTLDLRDAAGAQLEFNDNWKDSPQRAQIEQSGIAPTNDREAAIVRTLAPGSYTATVRGAGGATGIGLVEAYDIDSAADARLANISTRGFVETGDNVMIGGFIVGPAGRANSTIVIRAIGPSLTSRGVAGALGDPTVELNDANGTVIAANDNWKDAQQAEIAATGIAPTDDRESAILRVLGPGNYTAVVRGKDDSTGVSLVEAYNLGSP